MLRQQLHDLLAGVGVQLTGHVGDDGEQRRTDVHLSDDLPQRDAGGGHDPRVEGVRDGDLHGAVARLVESGQRLAYGRRLATDD